MKKQACYSGLFYIITLLLITLLLFPSIQAQQSSSTPPQSPPQTSNESADNAKQTDKNQPLIFDWTNGPSSPASSSETNASADLSDKPSTDADPEIDGSNNPNFGSAISSSPTNFTPNNPSLAATKPSGSTIAVIPVETEIYSFVKTSMERRVQRAVDSGASLIVFEFNTFGGELPAALEIAKFIKDPVKVPVETIAWVNNKAYSAGILLASACDEIVMSPASTIGDSAPIQPGAELSPTERAKALSPLLEEFRDNAREAGLDYAPFHAMCVLGVEVFYIQNPKTGERHLVNQADYAWMVNGDDFDTTLYKDDPYAVGAVTYEIAPINQPQLKGTWEPVSVLPSGAMLPNGLVHPGNTLFTLNQTRAQDIGISKATIATNQELEQYYSAHSLIVIPQTWSEGAAAFLTNPLIRGFLVIALLVGAYMEFQTPGIGIAGAVAVLALIILLGAPLIAGFADVWHIVMFFIGFVLLVIEIAFTPTFGLLGILGILMMFAGLVLSVVPSGGGPSFGPVPLPPSYQWGRVMGSTLSILGGTFVSVVCMYFITRYFGKIPFLNRLVLEDDMLLVDGSEVGMGLGRDEEAKRWSDVSGAEVLGEGEISEGAVGTADTDLRPAGTADFDGAKVDVVTRGEWIEIGIEVRVVEVSGNIIVVEEVRS
ncbi:hypothetical protein KS4_35640 [Poriferisphaera corsica]|uniref:Uncharacterized protein n=1 Tax=Poriferisphaera corsica TaxID=2528020 RepID=A0A517YZ28_9BACT|nr:NfeD family protein [Poriferisphaera corsica]QDU35481.1 hypothetical protein KS4_35640 [Poriferisphaera corsica]